MLGLWRKLRRRRLARRPLPHPWLSHLERRVAFYPLLPPELRPRFLTLLKTFIWEKHFIGAGGMEITDEVRVVIAAPAVRMVLHLDLSYYDRLTEIVVYPDHFRHPTDDPERVVYGEAHSWGTVVLSWAAVLEGLADAGDGLDTATHEFAHVLDRASGDFDGTPVLPRLALYQPWARVMTEHFLKLRQGERRQRRVLRSYGAQDEAEFFAVATEAFFERPQVMQRETPDLYALLQRFFGCDPAYSRQRARRRGQA